MSWFQEVSHSRMMRDPATWLLLIVGGLQGAVHTLYLREAARHAGKELRLPSLWLERGADLCVGALYHVVIILCAAVFLSGLAESWNIWLRRGVLVAAYVMLLGLRFLI